MRRLALAVTTLSFVACADTNDRRERPHADVNVFDTGGETGEVSEAVTRALTTVTPDDDARDVAPASVVVATYDGALPTAIPDEGLVVTDAAGNEVAGTLMQVDATLVFTPQSPFTAGATYTATAVTDVTVAPPRLGDETRSWTFTIAQGGIGAGVSLSPASNSSALTSQAFAATFTSAVSGLVAQASDGACSGTVQVSGDPRFINCSGATLTTVDSTHTTIAPSADQWPAGPLFVRFIGLSFDDGDALGTSTFSYRLFDPFLVTSTKPANGAEIELDLGYEIGIELNQLVDPASLRGRTDCSGSVAVSRTADFTTCLDPRLSSYQNKIAVAFFDDLEPGTVYVRLTAAVRSASGGSLEPYAFSYDLRGATHLVSSVPEQGQTLSPTGSVVLTYSAPLDASSVLVSGCFGSVYITNPSGCFDGFDAAADGAVLTLTPKAGEIWPAGTLAFETGGLRDAEGFAVEYTQVAFEVPTSPSVVISPREGAVVSRGGPVRLTFSTATQAPTTSTSATCGSEQVTVKNQAGQCVPGIVTAESGDTYVWRAQAGSLPVGRYDVKVEGAKTTGAITVATASVSYEAVDGYAFYLTATSFAADSGVPTFDVLCAADDAVPAPGRTFRAMVVDGLTRTACLLANCSAGTVGQAAWVLKPSTKYYAGDASAPYFTTNGNAIVQSPNGPARALTAGTNPWTGMNGDWTTGSTCVGWSTRSGGFQGAVGWSGDPGVPGSPGFISGGEVSCDSSRQVFCVEQ